MRNLDLQVRWQQNSVDGVNDTIGGGEVGLNDTRVAAGAEGDLHSMALHMECQGLALNSLCLLAVGDTSSPDGLSQDVVGEDLDERT